MAIPQSFHRIKMYDPSTHRTVEQRIMGALEPAGKGMVDFGSNFVKSLYGTGFAALRTPTFVRRCYNEQSLRHKVDKVESTPSHIWGFILGWLGGVAADVAGLYYASEQAGNGNYIPFIALGATNVASGIYELGRLKTSRREHLGLIKYKEWQQKKEEEKESGGFVE